MFFGVMGAATALSAVALVGVILAQDIGQGTHRRFTVLLFNKNGPHANELTVGCCSFVPFCR